MQKYFKVVKYLMETALREMSVNSFNKFYEHIISYIPDEVEIVSINEVKNFYGEKVITTTKTSSVEDSDEFVPLFETDLMRALDDSSFNFATGINNFTNIIMNIFNRMAEEINKIPEVEQKLMLEVFKKEKS
jgi:dynein heavy chain